MKTRYFLFDGVSFYFRSNVGHNYHDKNGKHFIWNYCTELDERCYFDCVYDAVQLTEDLIMWSYVYDSDKNFLFYANKGKVDKLRKNPNFAFFDKDIEE